MSTGIGRNPAVISSAGNVTVFGLVNHAGKIPKVWKALLSRVMVEGNGMYVFVLLDVAVREPRDSLV